MAWESRPKSKGVLEVWTPEGFKPVQPKIHRTSRGSGSRLGQRTDSLNPLLNRYMNPSEEAAARRREAAASARKRRIARTPAQKREEHVNPITMEHARYDTERLDRKLTRLENEPPPPVASPLTHRGRRQELDRRRYDPIRHRYAEAEVDTYVRDAEHARRDRLMSRRVRHESPLDPILQQRRAAYPDHVTSLRRGAPAAGMDTPSRARRSRSALAMRPSQREAADTRRVITPSPAPPPARARRHYENNVSSSRSGYNILAYNEVPVSDDNPNGVLRVRGQAGGRANRSGADYPILAYTPEPAHATERRLQFGTGSVRGGRQESGYDRVSRTSSALNVSRTPYNILTGEPTTPLH